MERSRNVRSNLYAERVAGRGGDAHDVKDGDEASRVVRIGVPAHGKKHAQFPTTEKECTVSYHGKGMHSFIPWKRHARFATTEKSM